MMKLQNMKIKTKVLITYFFMMILTISVIYVVSAVRINNVLLSQASNDLSSSTLQIKENIQNLLKSYETSTDYIVFNREFINDISHTSGDSLVKYDRTRKVMDIFSLLKNIDPSISSISVYMYEDSMLFDGKTFIKQSGAGGADPAYAEAGITWTGRHLNSKGTSVVKLNRLIFNYPITSKKIGILSVEIPESRFYEYIQKESLNKSIIIFNASGEIITGSNNQYLNETKDQLMMKLPLGSQGQFKYKINNEDYMLFYVSAANGWIIASYIPITALLSTSIDINRYVSVVILLSLIAHMVATTVIINLLISRLSQFTKAVHRVGEGQYNFAIDITGKDEVGQLADDFNKMIKRLDVLFNEVYVAQIKQKEAELQALQAQVNPHFLYNVLSSIGFAALKKNAPEIRNMLNNLAEFYRFSLGKGNTLVTLDEEIAQIKTYMLIQGMRFGSMVTVSYDIPPVLRDFKILKLTIQPFVENAIHHGIRNSETPLDVKITAMCEEDRISIRIQDNGAGIPAARLDEIQQKIQSGIEEKHYGIQNVHNRVRLYFGEAYGIAIDSTLGTGTNVVISLPLSR